MKRACCYVRVSTANKTRYGDAMTYDQDPAVQEGLQYARQHGTKSGRSIGRPRVVFRRDEVKELRAQGRSWREIAQAIGVSVASVRRACSA